MKKDKKTIELPPLSKEEQMAALAGTIMLNRANIKKASDALTAQEEELKNYLIKSGKKQIGTLRLEQAYGSLNWVGDKGKGLETKLAELTNTIDPKYKSIKLELESISAAIKSDPVLYGQLAKIGISLNRKANTIKLKEVKAQEK